MIEKKKLSTLKISVYIIAFYAVWSMRELYIQPVFLESLDSVASEIIGGIIKLLVWTLPAILLIKHFHDDMWIGLKEMFVNKINWSQDFYFLIAIIAIPLLRAFQAGFIIRPDFMQIGLVGAVVLVGITEEVVFRGFLLNTFLKKLKIQYAVALDAVLFTLIHYPIWIYRERDFSEFLTGSITVVVLSMFFAYSFIKTKKILIPIALHMVWNLSIRLFLSS